MSSPDDSCVDDDFADFLDATLDDTASDASNYSDFEVAAFEVEVDLFGHQDDNSLDSQRYSIVLRIQFFSDEFF